METITLYAPRLRFVLLTALALAFVLTGVWLLQRPHSAGRWDLMMAGWSGIVFFGGAGLFFLSRLLFPTPMLVIDDKGLTDNASAIGAGFLAWREIDRVVLKSFLGQDYIAIHVHDVEKYLAGANPLKRAILRTNAKIIGTPILLPTQSLTIGADEVMAAIRARLPRT